MTTPAPISFLPLIDSIRDIELIPSIGRVTQMVGLLIMSRGPTVSIGDFCEVHASSGRIIRSQVIGFRNGQVLSMPLEEIDGLQLGDSIVGRRDDARLKVGPQLLGRILDGFGRVIDEGPPIRARESYPLYGSAPNPLQREHITEPLATGIRAIDGMLP